MHGAGIGVRGFDIHHMATAAAIWLTAALGIAAGRGQWRLTGVATIAALFVLMSDCSSTASLQADFTKAWVATKTIKQRSSAETGKQSAIIRRRLIP